MKELKEYSFNIQIKTIACYNGKNEILRWGDFMNVQTLLSKGDIQCHCGRTHHCDTKTLLVADNVYCRIPNLLEGIDHVMVISDGNTRPLCGEKVIETLTDAGITVDEAYFDQTEVLVPDEKAIAYAERFVKEETRVIIGVGSGVINDLSKYIAYEHGIPSMIVATAPSMDGFASAGAVMFLKGLKVTCQRRAPRWIVADKAVLANAPIDMIRSGIGDIMGKYSALSDWKLAYLLSEEPMCDMIYEMVETELNACADNIDAIMQRNPSAIGRLMESLAIVGIALAYQGSSRPASGSEHLISHYFELQGVKNHEPYFPHGIDVGYASIVSEILRKRIADENPDDFQFDFNKAHWTEEIKRCFGDTADEIETLQEKNKTFEIDRSTYIRNHWKEIKAMLDQTPGVEFICGKLKDAGYDIHTFVDTYGMNKIRDAVCYATDIKTRYTLLQLLRDTGYLEKYAKELKL